MELSDIVSVIVVLNPKEREIYRDIVVSAGFREPFVIDYTDVWRRMGQPDAGGSEIKQAVARGVVDIVQEEKSVVIGQKHYLMAFCYNDGNTTTVIFDAHDDSFPGGHSPKFDDGNFLLGRKSPSHIIGTYFWPFNGKTVIYSPTKTRYIYPALKDAKSIFLSLEIDVFSHKVTSAHHYTGGPGRSWGGMSFSKVLYLSEGIVSGRELRGINLAGYDPAMEKMPYKTAHLLKSYLENMAGYLLSPLDHYRFAH